ncbi:MAG: GHKL domain-containing protein [Lachnospiraceae bacterium]|nr:GHKL domain-containing protein [Lachnospiraceae bacterium]
MGYTVVHEMYVAMEILIRGYFFYRLVKPFMFSGDMPDDMCGSEDIHVSAKKRKKFAFYVGAIHFLIIMLLYVMPQPMDLFRAYRIGSFIMFFLICCIDRRNYRQKAFLVIMFFSVSWLCAAMAEILYDNLYAYAEHTDYMQSHPDDPTWIALYAGVTVFYLTLEFVFTAIGIRQIIKVYRNKSADLEKGELFMLSLPSLMGMMAFVIIGSHRMVYIVEAGRKKDDYDILILLFYTATVVLIVVLIVLYQEIKARQEENRQAEILAVQIDSIRRHIGQVESLYQNIRSVRHDMTNHILTLERLYEGNNAEEAKAYSEELKTELSQMTGGIESGNPVTDVILQEFRKEAGKRGITFRSEFHYPVDSNINVFDMSVILNNALQNAIENIEKEKSKQISIESYRRKNAYIMEICNSFTGNLQWDAESGLPVTAKEKAKGHGYGLSNIRRTAGKYAGDIDIALKDGEFCLCIMLMLDKR